MKLRLPFKLAGIAALVLLTNAWADILPGGAMPDTVGRALTRLPASTPQSLPPQQLEPEKTPSPLGEQAKKIKFKLNGIIIEDNCVYSDAVLRPLYQNKIGQTISVAELFDIVQAITNYYRNNGYIISRAVLPPQHVKNGVVHIRVIEGYIGNVDVTEKPYCAKCQALYFGYKIKQCPPLEISRMEKYLLIANEMPGTSVRAVLAPSKQHVGAADLSLVTINRPATAYISYDNYGTRYIGPQQITTNFSFNSIFNSGDGAQITGTKTPKGAELMYIDANYLVPIDNEGDRWLVGATRTHTHPLYVLQPVQIDGLTENYYTVFTFPAIRKRSQNLTLRAGFNYLDSNVQTFDIKLYQDHIRSLDFGLTYNFADSWRGANLISTDFRQGLPFLGYTQDTSLTAQTSRPGGRADYSKITLTMSRLQGFPKGPFSLYLLVTGQWGFNPLLASEQFTFGGSQLGRGYDVAELIGDIGAAGTIELRYDTPIPRIKLNALQIYAFYDAGMIWNRLTAFGTPKQISGTSAGIGARFQITNYISGNVMWTQTLTKPVQALMLVKDEGRRPRVWFSVVASFG